jgi:hypothetical protein
MDVIFMGNYTSEQMLTIITAAGVFITALGGIAVNIIVALRTAAKTDTVIKAIVGDVTDPQKKGVVGQLEHITTLTNSTLSDAKAKDEKQQMQLLAMADLIRDLKSERDKLAQVAATAAAVAAQAAIPSEPKKKE